MTTYILTPKCLEGTYRHQLTCQYRWSWTPETTLPTKTTFIPLHFGSIITINNISLLRFILTCMIWWSDQSSVDTCSFVPATLGFDIHKDGPWRVVGTSVVKICSDYGSLNPYMLLLGVVPGRGVEVKVDIFLVHISCGRSEDFNSKILCNMGFLASCRALFYNKNAVFWGNNSLATRLPQLVLCEMSAFSTSQV